MNIFLYLKHFPCDSEQINDGTSKAVHGLAAGLVACGMNVTVICEGAQVDSFATTQAGYDLASFANKSTKPSFDISPNLKRYITNISTVDRSIFILNGIFHSSVYVLARFLKKHSLPYIVAPHDPYHPTIFKRNSYLKWPYWHCFERTLLKDAAAIQVLDKRHGEWLQRLGIDTPIIEVPNGFCSTDVHPESTLTWSVDTIPKFLFLGRLDAFNKGLDILLYACTRLTQLPDWNLTIQGPDWGDRLKLEKQAKQLNLTDRVTFLDPDYNLSPSSIVAKYDIFCITSRFEGFSLSALEAMLAGRVLLVSEIAGISPHVAASGCGVVVSPTPQSIELGLLELLAKRAQWQEMGLRGRHYVVNNLDWNSIAARAIKDYLLTIDSSINV
jgi:glycosyltransferase involved in cell wall biosynthesis